LANTLTRRASFEIPTTRLLDRTVVGLGHLLHRLEKVIEAAANTVTASSAAN
jgi:hypothetical protein